MTDANRQKILTEIDANKEGAIAFLQKMVSIPSVTGDEAAIQKFVADHMKSIGLSVDMWETNWEELKKHPGYRPVDRGYAGRPNIVGTLKGTGGGRSLLLNGHTDVIPVGKGEGWSDDPWSGENQEWPHLRPRLLRHEERRREPHPCCRVSEEARAHAQGRCDDQRGHRRGGERPRDARHRHPRLSRRRGHFRRDQRSRGAAGVYRPDLVRDRDPWETGRHPAALSWRQRHRPRQYNHESRR